MCVIVEGLSVYVIPFSLFFGFRLKEHVQDPSNNPILIFPEGAYEGEKKGGEEGRGAKAEKEVLSRAQHQEGSVLQSRRLPS